jgi:hypothetical protein
MGRRPRVQAGLASTADSSRRPVGLAIQHHAAFVVVLVGERQRRSGVDFGLIAMIIGVLIGNRGLALGLTSALAAASYLVSALAPIASWAHTIRPVSLFYWAVGNDQLTAGPSTSAYAVLVLVGVGLHLAAAALIQRLDIR